jgi:hypothetical protein
MCWLLLGFGVSYAFQYDDLVMWSQGIATLIALLFGDPVWALGGGALGNGTGRIFGLFVGESVLILLFEGGRGGR